MKTKHSLLVAASVALAMAFTFSCSEEVGEGGRFGNSDDGQDDTVQSSNDNSGGNGGENPNNNNNNNNNNPSSNSGNNYTPSSTSTNSGKNCQISNQCYDMGEADCSHYGGTPSTCTRTTLLCNDYCLWSGTGECTEISTDPLGVYGGAGHSTCAAAIANCDSYGRRFSNTTCTGTSITSPSSSSSRPNTTPSSSSAATVQAYYCDTGYPSFGDNSAGCFEVDYTSDCDPEYGRVVSNCNSGRRTDLRYCDWGPYLGPYDASAPEGTTGGGCHKIENTTAATTSCTNDYGTVVTKCPAASL